MSDKNDKGKFWPYMILGFLAIGIILSYWTVKSASSIPVHESNEFMLRYQDADKLANEIQEAQDRFDRKYIVEFEGLEISNFKPKNLKRKANLHYKLEDNNTLIFKISTKDGKPVEDANLTVLLTRPQTTEEDRYLTDIKRENGIYKIENVEIKNRGRYIFKAKFQIKDAVKFLNIYGVKL